MTLEQEGTRLLATFALGEALFAVDALAVQEIIRSDHITPVHRAPAHVLGIINLRGHIVTILDGALRLRLEAPEPSFLNRILVLDWQGEAIGLRVTRVQDVVTVEPGQLGLLPPNLKAWLGSYSREVIQLHGHVVSILDLGTLLRPDESE